MSQQGDDPNNIPSSNSTSSPGVATSTSVGYGQTLSTSASVTSNYQGPTQPLQSPATTSSDTITVTTLPTSTGIPPPRINGVSWGTVAGAAVGAAVAGAFIAFLVTWICLRPKKRQMKHQDLYRGGGTGKDLIEISAIETPADSIRPGHQWEKHLPQSIDDNCLRLNMRTLFHQVELHVENFYSDIGRCGSPKAHDIQAGMEPFDSEFLPASVATLMQQSSASIAVMKHCLMVHIISNISLTEMGESSFLPAECTALVKVTRNAIVTNKPGATEAYSRWRVLTAYLRLAVTTNADNADNTASGTAAWDAAIQAAATKFSAAFAPWATTRKSDGDRIQNLVDIMRNASQFGVSLFSQASDFQYSWTAPSNGKSQSRAPSRGRGSRSIVVTPGFVKVTDENARPLQHGQVLLSPVVAQI